MLSLKSCPIFLFNILFAQLLFVCSAFVILSSAEGGDKLNIFQSGEVVSYKFYSSVLFNERFLESKHVGFFVDGVVDLSVLWQGKDHTKVFKLELKSPKLHVRSGRASTSDGFTEHSSKLDQIYNKPFLLVWKQGVIEKILFAKNEVTSLRNIKKAIASLFQFQLLDLRHEETDVSGRCDVLYESLSATSTKKTKFNCSSTNFNFVKHPEMVLSTQVTSSRTSVYSLDSSSSFLDKVTQNEEHEMYLTFKNDVGGYASSEVSLTFLERKKGALKQFQKDDYKEVLELINQESKFEYQLDTLTSDSEEVAEEPKNFVKLVEELRPNLEPSLLGEVKPAGAFLKLIPVARKATKEQIKKVLTNKKNLKILPQVYDLLGYVQTEESHQTASKQLSWNKEDEIDLTERYLWALSFSSHPNLKIAEDLLNKFKNYLNIPDKLKETLILTVASMAQKLDSKYKSSVSTFIRNLEESLLNELNFSEKPDLFYRALKNLRTKSLLPHLINLVKTKPSKEAALAWKAIKSFGPSLWNQDVLKAAKETLYQRHKKEDSSSRTIASDVILLTDQSEDSLKSLLEFIVKNETQFEVQRYILQHLQMLAEENFEFGVKLSKIIKDDRKLNNYHGLAPKGLSTVIRRPFLNNTKTLGTLTSVQEINNKFVKRGVISVDVGVNSKTLGIFDLGIFSGGLSSFTSNSDSDLEPETATAGMELTVLGTQIRPFVFFDGQGELMGHVWSGTASERTNAFQALIMLFEHQETLRLGSGFLLKLDAKGVVSFDLSGQVEMSLWNRDSQSLVEQSGGIVTTGSLTVDSSIVRSTIEYQVSLDPKLRLESDVDFSGPTKMCMRLAQPDCLYRHNVFKIERIPGSKHKIRIAKYKKSTIPGKTYALNRKSNQMCSLLGK